MFLYIPFFFKSAITAPVGVDRLQVGDSKLKNYCKIKLLPNTFGVFILTVLARFDNEYFSLRKQIYNFSLSRLVFDIPSVQFTSTPTKPTTSMIEYMC